MRKAASVRTEKENRNPRGARARNNISGPGREAIRIRSERNQNGQPRSNEAGVPLRARTFTKAAPISEKLLYGKPRRTSGGGRSFINDPAGARNNTDASGKINDETLNEGGGREIARANHSNASARNEERGERSHKKGVS